MEKVNLETEVIIVGAGPTGLMLANQLERFGIKYIIVDKKPATVQESRAIGVQARTVEFYHQLGLAQKAINQGYTSRNGIFFNGEKLVGVLDFASKYKGAESPYIFILDLEQNKNEKILLENLKNKESLYFSSTVVDVGQTETEAWVRFENGDKEYRVKGSYLVAADGSNSIVRRLCNVEFVGKRYDTDFLVMDIEGSIDDRITGIAISNKKNTLGLTFRLRSETENVSRFRLFVTVPVEDSKEKNQEFAISTMYQNFPKWLKIDKVTWFSYYHVSCKMIENFRKSRIFFAGDSAHVHSSAGGQGMNTGIGDSVNLGWKLAYVLQNKADEKLLETYNFERIRFAKGLLASTDKVFSFVAGENLVSRFVVKYIFPILIKIISSFSLLQTKFFERLSQLQINHHTSSLSNGKIGKLRGGDRLPYFVWDNGSKNSFDFCKTDKFVVFLFSSDKTGSKPISSKFEYELVIVNDKSIMEKFKLPNNSFIEVRPDMYISSCGVCED